MSRPPNMQAPQENSYNGGLIDFHESVLRSTDLGQAMYAQQLAAQNQYQSSYQPIPQTYGAMPGAPVGTPNLAYGMGAPYAGNGVPAPVQSFYQQPAAGPPPGTAQSMMMAQATSQCIAGPPAFLHLHGKVYAPVEDAATGVPAAPEPQARTAVKEPAGPPSGKTFDRVVEKRIEQKVDEFICKNFKNKAMDKNMKKKGGGKDDFGLKDLNNAMRSRIRGY